MITDNPSSPELSAIIQHVQEAKAQLGYEPYGPAFVAFTDGSCRPGPDETSGCGGWGIVLFAPRGEKWELRGTLPDTTSNRAELCALLAALAFVPEGSRLSLQSDSKYLVDGIRRHCRGTDHQDLWCEARELAIAKQIEVHASWVGGHRGHPHNARADALASGGVRSSRGRRTRYATTAEKSRRFEQTVAEAIGAN